MKSLILPIFVSLAFVVASCSGGSNSTNPETEALKAENEQLKKDLNERDETVNEFMKSFNEIEENLITVQGKEKGITAGNLQNSAELKGDAKARIEAEIQSINELMEKNKAKIAELQKKLKKSNLKIQEFEKTIERLNQMVAERDAEIASLNERLIALNYKVESLHSDISNLKNENDAKAQEIEQKTDEMNTAYYTVGTKKELIANGVLSKDGSFSGSMKGSKMTVNYDSQYFTKIDIRKQSEIIISGKKAKLLSSHPAASFSLDGQKLVIKDAAAFWKASKYCVIEVN
jgi:DNA repair exonuclease SbcCD ATPase subunit